MSRDARIIKTARKLKGWTQTQLAEKLNISEPTVRRLERGDPSVDKHNVARAAHVLGLEYDWTSGQIKPPIDIPSEAYEPDNNGASTENKRAPEPDADFARAMIVVEKFIMSGRIDVEEVLRRVAAAAKGASARKR